MLIEGAKVMLHPHQGGRAPRMSECKAAAAGQSVQTAEPQQTAAPLTRQEHNRAQTIAFSKLEAVQASRQPPDLPIYQASAFEAARVCTGCVACISNHGLNAAFMVSFTNVRCLGRSWSASRQQCLVSARIRGWLTLAPAPAS
jgi:hypothetical protein